MTVGGSQQLRIFRRARRDGKTLHTSAVLAGMSLGEARLHDAADRENPPPPEAYELLGGNHESPGVAASESSELGPGTAGSGRDTPTPLVAPASPEPRNPPAQETNAMARPKKAQEGTINGEVPKPDFDLADKIHREDIAPANKEQKRAMKEASDGWKSVKRDARVHVGGARTAFKVAEMEEAEQQAWLRSFAGVLRKRNVSLHADLADQAEGQTGELPIVPTGQRQRPQLATVPKAPPPGDTDLAGEEQQQAAE